MQAGHLTLEDAGYRDAPAVALRLRDVDARRRRIAGMPGVAGTKLLVPGQGVASSPIQLVAAINTIANDGLYVAPRLVLGTVDHEGELHDADPSAERRVVSEAVAVEVQSMMQDVVCRSDGTANAAQVPGAWVS